MRYKILDTTDDAHEGEIFEVNGEVEPGKDIIYKDKAYKVDTLHLVSPKVIKVVSSNYIVMLEVLGK